MCLQYGGKHLLGGSVCHGKLPTTQGCSELGYTAHKKHSRTPTAKTVNPVSSPCPNLASTGSLRPQTSSSPVVPRNSYRCSNIPCRGRITLVWWDEQDIAIHELPRIEKVLPRFQTAGAFQSSPPLPYWSLEIREDRDLQCF